jgi:hypothetical protein
MQILQTGIGKYIYWFGFGVRILPHLKNIDSGPYAVTNLTKSLNLEILEPEKGFSKDLRKLYSAKCHIEKCIPLCEL